MFSMCSELTPRAHVPDNRIPQLMQPCEDSKRKKRNSLSLLTDKAIFSCPGQLQRKKTNECLMEKFPDHFATSSQNPSQPFGGMYEIKFVFPRAEIPSEIANLLFPATLIFFSDRKFLFSNHCQVVRKKLCTFS